MVISALLAVVWIDIALAFDKSVAMVEGSVHSGAVAPEFIVNTCPAVPFINLVPAPLAPP